MIPFNERFFGRTSVGASKRRADLTISCNKEHHRRAWIFRTKRLTFRGRGDITIVFWLCCVSHLQNDAVEGRLRDGELPSMKIQFYGEVNRRFYLLLIQKRSKRKKFACKTNNNDGWERRDSFVVRNFILPLCSTKCQGRYFNVSVHLFYSNLIYLYYCNRDHESFRFIVFRHLCFFFTNRPWVYTTNSCSWIV